MPMERTEARRMPKIALAQAFDIVLDELELIRSF
jgi:hypothetical protein